MKHTPTEIYLAKQSIATLLVCSGLSHKHAWHRIDTAQRIFDEKRYNQSIDEMMRNYFGLTAEYAWIFLDRSEK